MIGLYLYVCRVFFVVVVVKKNRKIESSTIDSVLTIASGFSFLKIKS